MRESSSSVVPRRRVLRAPRLALFAYAVALVVVMLDQLTKWLAEHQLVLYAPVEVTSFFNFTLVYNPGAAFSFLGGAGDWARWMFTIFALAVSVVLVVWLARLDASRRWTALGLALLLGGAIGNVIDRLRIGMVVDFLDFHWAGMHWPAFNLADSAITVGAALIIVAAFTESQDIDSERRSAGSGKG